MQKFENQTDQIQEKLEWMNQNSFSTDQVKNNYFYIFLLCFILIEYVIIRHTRIFHGRGSMARELEEITPYYKIRENIPLDNR